AVFVFPLSHPANSSPLRGIAPRCRILRRRGAFFCAAQQAETGYFGGVPSVLYVLGNVARSRDVLIKGAARGYEVPGDATFMNDHFADRAGFLAALSRSDPERKLAEEHAHSCGPCREALAEGGRLLSLLRRALPTTQREPIGRPLPAMLQGASAASIARQLAWATTGAVVLAWLFQLTVGGGFRLYVDCALVSLAV